MDLVKRCPTCGTESPPAALRCACGALLAHVDLVAPAATNASERASTSPNAAAGDPPGEVCPHADCGQPNRTDALRCVYCDRPLPGKAQGETGMAAATAPDDAPAAIRVTLKWPWGERMRVTEALLVGRTAEVLPELAARLEREYDNVSRRHALLRIEGGILSVEDLGSANGTFLNGIRLPPKRPVRVRHGATLRFAADLAASVRIEDV